MRQDRREYNKLYQREWRAKHVEHYKEYRKQYRVKNKERIHELDQKWRNENRELYRERHRSRVRKLRMEVVSHYGSKCVCCGEREYEFLTFDHINGDGAKRRKASTLNPAETIRRDGYPSDIQILCYNCNCAKANYGGCPHQKKEN